MGFGELFAGIRALQHAAGRRRLIVIAAAAFICCYATSVLAYVVNGPEIGLRCAFNTSVNEVYKEYLLDGAFVQDLSQSKIVDVGGHRVDSWPQLVRRLKRLGDDPIDAQYSTAESGRPSPPADFTHVLIDGEQYVRVRLEKSGEPITVWCRLGTPPLATLLPSLLWFLLRAGLFVVAAIVFWKRPGDRSAAQFFALSIVTFGAYMGGYQWSRIITQPALLLTFIVCAVFVPAVTLHFYLVFPRTKRFFERRPRLTYFAIYGTATAFLLFFLWSWWEVRTRFAENALSVDGLLEDWLGAIYIYFGVAALWYVASIVCLIHSFRNAADATERNQVKVILLGGLASLVPIGYTLYLAFWQRPEFGAGAGTWPMFAASVCVTTAYIVSITRYRLMQLDQIVSSGAVYFGISFLAGVLYYAVVFVGTLIFSQWNPSSFTQAIVVSSAALVLILALDWLRGRVKKALDRRFSRQKHQLERTLRRLSQAVEQLVDPPALARRLLQASTDLLGVRRAAVYLREGEPPIFRLADGLGPAVPLSELSSGCPLIEALHRDSTLVACRRLGAPPDLAQRQMNFLGGEVAQGLVHEGRLLALLVLGPKDVGPYTAEDLNLLGAFSQLTALALESARGHRTIEALNRDLHGKVEKISEQQRRILALQSQLRSRESRGEEREGKNGDSINGTPPSTQSAAATGSDAGVSMIGSSTSIRQLLREARQVAASPSAVLLRGESGTGKGLLAHMLHASSPRAAKPFVKVHCAALSPGLLESELFGHVKGAFTGAHRDKIGRFELANGGTLFLDEIGDIGLDVQTKLLRVLEEMTFERVGSSEPVQVDVRVIAATHQNLEHFITQGRFREDLYYRLNVISVTAPPLRERVEDIPELVMHFLRFYAQRSGKAIHQIDDDVLAALKAHSWPGNIRQLENVIERAVVVADGPTVTLQDLPPELVNTAERTTPVWAVLSPANVSVGLSGRGVRAERADRDRRDRERLVRALAAADGNKAEAARALGLARSTLVSRLRKLGLQ